jgi:hypothetical protein
VVAAAFGERVEGVLQLQGSYLLIVRYRLDSTVSGAAERHSVLLQRII